jgi:hypothetical protein
MALIGRLLVRGTAAAGAVGAAVVIGLAPQPAVATTLTFDDHGGTTSSIGTSEPAPSAACFAAKTAFFSALKADVAEDSSERDLAKTGTNTNDPGEDQAERSNFTSLRGAMVKACEPQEATEQGEHQKPAPSAACTSAKSAMVTFFTKLRATEKTEWTNGTEGSTSDMTEDMATFAQLKTLFGAVATACGFE